MDVVEHLVTVLRTVLDYVGLDLEDLPHPEWLDRRHELSIRYRSVVRLIASLLPPKPARRLHLQPQLLQRCDRYGGSGDSLCTTYSDPLDDLDLQSDDLVWVEEDLGNGCIQMRPQDRNQLSERGVIEEMDKGLYVLRQFPERQTSTPINRSLSIMSQTDPGAMMKISMLEDELTKLRLQIAQIVIAQENNTLHKSTIVTDAPSEIVNEDVTDSDEDKGSVTTDAELLPTDPLVSESPTPSPGIPVPTPPPPPSSNLPAPPPPPPIPHPSVTENTSSQVTTTGPSFLELLNKKKASLHSTETTSSEGTTPALSEVLRGLGSIKLRAVQRSPGGTPVRQAPKQAPHSDPTFLIAQALKKKFAFRNLHDSLENDKENEFSSSSAESTPRAGFVPVALKKKFTRRRSSLCTDSTDVPASEPLRDHNMRV